MWFVEVGRVPEPSWLGWLMSCEIVLDLGLDSRSFGEVGGWIDSAQAELLLRSVTVARV